MPADDRVNDDYRPLAEIGIDSVEPVPEGFRLSGTGTDAAEYRLDMHLDVPVDRRTQAVLSELLAQTEWRLWRRGAPARNPKQGHKLGRSGSRAPA